MAPAGGCERAHIFHSEFLAARRCPTVCQTKKEENPKVLLADLHDHVFLEAELYTQCYLARVAAPGGSGLVEGRLVGYQIVPLRGRGDRCGLVHAAGGELWMIEQVEKSCREIQTAPFRDVEVLGDAEVPVVNTGSGEVSLTSRG